MDTPEPRPAQEDTTERDELTVTVRLTSQIAKRVRRSAAIQQRPVEEVTAECIGDEMRRHVHGALYSSREDYASTLEGLAQQLALIARDLGELPSSAAARVVALAQAEQGNPLPGEWHQRMIEQLTTLWAGRTTEFGRRPDGSFGPLDRIKVSAVASPEQWDALVRIGAPDNLGLGTQKALEVGIAALDT